MSSKLKSKKLAVSNMDSSDYGCLFHSLTWLPAQKDRGGGGPSLSLRWKCSEKEKNGSRTGLRKTTAKEDCLCINNTELRSDVISPLGRKESREVVEACYETSSELDFSFLNIWGATHFR